MILPDLEPAGLEVCPFCGSDNVKLRTDSKAAMSWVACISCGLETPTETGVSSEEVVAYWNRRAARSTVPEAGKAVVKPLEWEERDGDLICRKWDHKITTHDGKWGLSPIDWPAFDMPYDSADEAKAAAQADYEARIKSALQSDTTDINSHSVDLDPIGLKPGAPQAVPAEDVAGLQGIPRYSITAINFAFHGGRLLSSDDGKWVKYADVAAALTSLSAERDRFHEWAKRWQDIAETACTVLGLGQIDPPDIVEAIRAKFTASEAEATSLRHRLDMLQADFNDCNSVRADLRRRLEEAEAEIERMTPKFVAYEYLESPAGREIAEARVAVLEGKLEEYRRALADSVSQIEALCSPLDVPDSVRAVLASGASE